MASDSAGGSTNRSRDRTFERPGGPGSQRAPQPDSSTFQGRAAGTDISLESVGAATDSGSGRRSSKGNRPPTRKARLRIARVDPWSVMKTSLMFSIAGGIIFFVAVWVMWGVIDASGVLTKMQDAITALVGASDGSSSVQITNYINQWRILGFTAIVAVIEVVLTTAVCTLFSFLYNLAAQIIGGLEVTLAED
ncbi:DUF3566 domain-containing protein [Propionibacterium sp.]|uniref:DUF3566 domain-containing protein n=1 Tax=Propionibacterium sp. TaxID=1977903 RepID=UPI0039EC8A24